MNSEKKYQIKVIISLLVILVCSGLYAWGGMENKWLRRFLAPSICASYLAILCKDWKQLLKAPLLGIASSIGYGADVTWLKIVKRTYVGLSFAIGATITDIISAIRDDRKKWFVVGYSTVAIVSAYILYGVFNPVHARVEETFLSMIVYTMAILPSIKE